MFQSNMPVSRGNIFFFYRDGDYPFEHSHNNYWEMIVVVKGNYTHKINDSIQKLKECDLCIIRPEDFHSTYAVGNNCAYITCCINTQYFENLLYNLSPSILPFFVSEKIIQTRVKETNMDEIVELSKLYSTSEEPKNEHYAMKLLLKLISEFISYYSDNYNKKTYSKCVLDFMELLNNPKNLSKSLKELIASTTYSYSYVNNVFREEVGESASKYLKKKQLLYAKKMLINSRLKHIEIASSIGFSSQSKFCTFFKRMTGVTPSEYAKQSKNVIFESDIPTQK